MTLLFIFYSVIELSASKYLSIYRLRDSRIYQHAIDQSQRTKQLQCIIMKFSGAAQFQKVNLGSSIFLGGGGGGGGT